MAKRGSRGRIVMLVDNGVEGDSRVQKQARSAAAAGWDVVLLGRSPDKKVHRWKFGDARVRLVPMPTPLSKDRHRNPRRYDLHLARARVVDTEYQRNRAAFLGGGSSLPVRAAWRLRKEYADRRLRLVERRGTDVALGSGRGLTAGRARRDQTDEQTTASWERKLGTRAWRRLDPGLWDWELAYGPVIDKLQPDLIHANDFRMLGVGSRAKLRAWAAGRDVKLVWDAHEYLPGRTIHHQSEIWHRAQILHEKEHVPFADAVTTTSEMMADLLRDEHGLAELPTIVRNAPTTWPETAVPSTPDVRSLCGLADDVPLLLYLGVTAPQRGVDTVVEALPQLDGVHMALIARETPNRQRLTDLAESLGVSDRLHPLPYVPVDEIVPHIRTASVGVFPALHNLSHDSDLPTKYYEYAQARLPMVVSDVKTSAETTQRLGNGEVFAAGEVDDLVRALKAVLGDLSRYRSAYDAHEDELAEWTWEHQATVLDSVYTRLLTPGG
ncbi:MAG: glycosyltransferase family 4 protein [Actinomycetes bacterium]